MFWAPIHCTYFRNALYFDFDPVDISPVVMAEGPLGTREVQMCERNPPWAIDLEQSLSSVNGGGQVIHPQMTAKGHTSMERRWAIITRWKALHSASAVAADLGEPFKTVARWVKRYQETGGVDSAPKSGRRPTLTASAVVWITHL